MACGCFQNVVAVGAGFTEGLGYGDNTKAAVIRLGLMEMTEFCRRFFESTVNILTKSQIKKKCCHTVSVIDYSRVKVWVLLPVQQPGSYCCRSSVFVTCESRTHTEVTASD